MPDSRTLAPGKTAPSFVDGVLSRFGQNLYGEPMFRVVWSERPQNFLAGEMVPTYEYLQPPRWIVEKWLAPQTYAGPKEAWGQLQQEMMGDYPSQGVYYICDSQLPVDWEPNEHDFDALVQALISTMETDITTRKHAKIDALKAEEQRSVMKTADAVMESFDSAELGKIQQSVSGPKNTFRSPEDWERERDKAAWHSAIAKLPRKGLKIYQPEE